jgi:hypothetical protein
VRDLLYLEDLLRLIDEQLSDPDRSDGVTANVGGGPHCSLSLLETTEVCSQIPGRGSISAANRDEPGGRPDVRLRLPQAVRAHRLAPP